MITPKTILGVVIVAILIGVVYVSFEKNFSPAKTTATNPKASSSQQLSQEAAPVKSSIITLPTPQPTLAPIDESTDLLNEASSLEMRDYSTLFEELKDKAQE